MGGGIARVAAQAGYRVKLSDGDVKLVEKALERIGAFLEKRRPKFTGRQ